MDEVGEHFATVIATKDLGLENVALMLAGIFVILPSFAHLELSFSCLNQIKIKVIGSMGVEKPNNCMGISKQMFKSQQKWG